MTEQPKKETIFATDFERTVVALLCVLCVLMMFMIDETNSIREELACGARNYPCSVQGVVQLDDYTLRSMPRAR
jgi:hypothetical protein